MSFFSQTSRMGRLSTVLGQDVLVLQRFEGRDQINDIYTYQVDCLAGQSDINFDQLLGTHATVTLETRQGERHFDGIVTETRWLGAGENGHRYRLHLKPWFYLSSLRRNQRIFHNMTVVEILEELLEDYAEAGDFSINLIEDYPELEYTVQYRESDMAFACRMMERFGISYHFKHSKGAHELVITDVIDNHDTIGERPFRPDEGHHQEDIDHFWEWRPARRMTTGAIRLTDYNFKTPMAAMESDHFSDNTYEQGEIESFDWPGDYLDGGRGKVMAKLRAAGEHGQAYRYEAIGDILALGSGTRVVLGGDPVPGSGEEYMCLRVDHSYTSDSYGTGDGSGSEYAYVANYVLMPSSAPLVPERKTALADVRGPQTAMVVGKGEIDCDDYGRILVKFHWDLAEDFSMRCRVSQNWAGSSWGGMVIPRVGMEVVVEFLDGNPDKPLVTGCVYNGRTPTPMELPKDKTRSTFKTNSVGGEGFNELTFEDKAGEEFVYLHAAKNLEMHVENSSKRRVEFDDNVSVGHNSKLDVAVDRIETIGGKLDLHVTKNRSEEIDGKHGLTVKSDIAIESGGDLSLKAGGEIVIDASKITLVSGNAAVVLQGGKVDVSPRLNVGNASPSAGVSPTIPEILQIATGEGNAFVSHCPLKDA